MRQLAESAENNLRSVFKGREDELTHLKNQWNLAKLGYPQMQVFVGPRGIGKTRILQEFYSVLSLSEDPPQPKASQGYWPNTILDSRTGDLDPSIPDKFYDGKPEIPWLWWGLSVAPRPVSNPPFLVGERLLAIHELLLKVVFEGGG